MSTRSAPVKSASRSVHDPLSWYSRNRLQVLARQRSAYQADPLPQRAAVRASLAKRDLAILHLGLSLGLASAGHDNPISLHRKV